MQTNSPFEPERARTSNQEVEMTEDRRAFILFVEELAEEDVHCCAEWPDCEVADVFGEDEQREGETEGEVHEGRLGVAD